MELPKQVTSLELSLQLKEAGVKQEGLLWWVYLPGGARIILKERADVFPDEAKFSAFTAAELGELLPHKALGAYLMCCKGIDDWSCAYGAEKTIYANSEAEARGQMLIYLAEQKLVSLTK